MTEGGAPIATLRFDDATRALVRLSARIAGGSESDVRDGLHETVAAGTSAVWVEEVILQSYLFCGFPRALNAAREWRRVYGVTGDDAVAETRDFAVEGEATCAKVYGKLYEKLRHHVAALHPSLDEWMVVEGYGKVLSRPALDLGRRELCIIAACLASGQERQLNSHLYGARNVGVPDEVIGAALDGLIGVADAASVEAGKALWQKVLGQ